MTSSTPFRLQLPRQLYDEMVKQAVAELPNECCGLLCGQLLADAAVAEGMVGRVRQRYPLLNAAASPREFLSDPKSMFEAIRDMRRFGDEILAVYHSHPTSEPIPSRTDLERNYSPDIVSLIISLNAADPFVRGWWLTETGFKEAVWGLIDN